MSLSAFKRLQRSLEDEQAKRAPERKLFQVFPEDECVGAIAVLGVRQVSFLVSEITSGTRSWPVIGLTARKGEQRPALSPAAVRAIVGPEPLIYLIPHPLTYVLRSQLPDDGLRVSGGAARVWWPMSDLDPGAHPLIIDRSGEYGDTALADIARVFEQTRPSENATVA